MSTITITTPRLKHSAETRNAGVSLSGCLDEGETLTGTPTVTGSPSGLTITAAAVTATIVNIEGVDVPAAEAVTFTVAGGTDGITYTITVSCGTSAGQTVVRKCILKVTDN